MKQQMIALIIIAAIAVVAGAVYYGYIDLDEFGIGQLGNLGRQENDAPDNAEKQSFSNHEIFDALCILTGKNLSWTQTDAYIDSLHLELYGINDESYVDVQNYYADLWIDEGYTLYDDGLVYTPGYTAYSAIYYNGLADGRAFIAGSGVSVTSYYGYDVMVLVGHGPLTTWISFVSFINSS